MPCLLLHLRHLLPGPDLIIKANKCKTKERDIYKRTGHYRFELSSWKLVEQIQTEPGGTPVGVPMTLKVRSLASK